MFLPSTTRPHARGHTRGPGSWRQIGMLFTWGGMFFTAIDHSRIIPILHRSYNYMSSTLDQTLTITTIDIYVYNEFQSLLIAINRFIAMYAPLHYNKLCSVKVSVVSFNWFLLVFFRFQIIYW